MCTSTLIEGVNLACRTIVVCGPKKGKANPMSGAGFLELSRDVPVVGAQTFMGILCASTPTGSTYGRKAYRGALAYRIERQTDTVLSDVETLTNYIRTRAERAPNTLDKTIDPVASYLIAYYMRIGSAMGSPSVRRMDAVKITALDDAIKELLSSVQIPEVIASAHPSISAVAMQALLTEFRDYKGDAEELLPAPPESDDAVRVLQGVFSRINRTLDNAFDGSTYQLACAIITVDWMRGKRIGEIISNMIRVRRRRQVNVDDADFNYAGVIRETFQRIEEVARFKAPKFLSAYLDVLRFHFQEVGRVDRFPEELKIEALPRIRSRNDYSIIVDRHRFVPVVGHRAQRVSGAKRTYRRGSFARATNRPSGRSWICRAWFGVKFERHWSEESRSSEQISKKIYEVPHLSD